MSEQTFCLKWDGFSSRLSSVFDELRCDEELVDVTLCCDGGMIGAHRVVLSACSPYFRDVFKSCKYPHMALVLMNVAVAEARALVEFMYRGRVNIQQSRLSSFIKTASLLQIRGLNGDGEQNLPSPVSESTVTDAAAPSDRPTSGSVIAPPAAAVTSRQRPSSFPSHESPPVVPTAPAVGAVRQQTPAPVKREEVKVEDGYDCSAGSPLTDGMLDAFMSTDGGDHRSVHVPLSQELCYSALDSRLTAGRNAPGHRRSLSYSRENGKFSKYVCSVCSKQYSSRSALAHHMKLHQGQTECSLCGRVYASVPTLREHLKVVHKLSEQQVQDIAPKRRYDLPQNTRVLLSVNDLLTM